MLEWIRKLRNAISQRNIRSSVVTITVFVIAAGIAAFAGIGFYRTEKLVLQQRGELNAKESALEYNNCLITRANIITLVGCSVDDMIASGKDNEAIESYITEQSNYIIEALDPSTTGLYGWINGQYLDGAGWVPDDDYVATERPWYIQTLSSDRQITFVNPYLDLNTGTIMMTVTELLGDGESVIAMDVSLDPLQQIVERIASTTEGSQAFVIDRQGNVVVHSDERQVGLNYMDAPDSLGGAVSRRILEAGQTQFDLKTGEGNYSVYVDILEGGWYSVSLINANIWYRPLQRVMMSFSIILVLVMVFVLGTCLNIQSKEKTLDTLHTRINEEEKRGQELKILSETDRMTGLHDRVSGKRKVEELLAFGIGGTFLELDIDHFKSINDTYGHQTGDQVILAVADALHKSFRSNDITMRLGGDEFGAFAVGITDRRMAEMIINRLFDHIAAIVIPEMDGHVCISVGASFCTDSGERSFDDLYAASDQALYASKKVVGSSLTFES